MSDLLTLVFQWFAQATGNVRMHLVTAEESKKNNNNKNKNKKTKQTKNAAVYAEFQCVST